MTTPTGITVAPVREAGDLDAVVALFRAYAASLPIDLAYQGFEAEMAAMPGRYAPPAGALLLARDGTGRAVGCVGLRPLGAGICEMKRLYLLPETRGTGLGRRLVEAVIEAAERIGYREMRLDTLAGMTDAQALYRRFGFEPMAAYYETPIPDTVFMRLRLGVLPP